MDGSSRAMAGPGIPPCSWRDSFGWVPQVPVEPHDLPLNCSTAFSRLFDPTGPPDHQEGDWPLGREGIGGAAHGAVERHPDRPPGLTTAMSEDRSPPLPYL